MNIYIGHSREMDYINELYNPIENSDELKEFNIIFPHKKSRYSSNGRDFYKDINLFIAEVTYPATGLGIELGWAYDEEIPIYCFYKTGSKISSSLKSVTNNFVEYSSVDDLINGIKNVIYKHKTDVNEI